MERIALLGSAVDDLQNFPEIARRRAGFQRDRVQRGADPDDRKPMTAMGAGVREVGVRDADGAFRAIDIAHRADVIDMLHAFEKSQRTSKRDLDPAVARFRQVVDR